MYCLQHSFTFFVCFFVCLQSCQADLVKDNGHKYFLSVLADAYMRVSQIQPFTECVFSSHSFSLVAGLACQHLQLWLGSNATTPLHVHMFSSFLG